MSKCNHPPQFLYNIAPNEVVCVLCENIVLYSALKEASHMVFGELYHNHPTYVKVKEALDKEKMLYLEAQKD